MKEHQLLRLAGVAAILVAYIARLISVGSGKIDVFGYTVHPLALVGIVVVLLAAPETLDRLPFGPSK